MVYLQYCGAFLCLLQFIKYFVKKDYKQNNVWYIFLFITKYNIILPLLYTAYAYICI